MSGDFAPMQAIAGLLAQFPKLHLYSDDAHATSWLGRHGRGLALQELPDRSRVVVTLSLNKAFSAAGGALIVPSDAIRDRIRHAGAAMMFSGPIQPPMLGAAVASSRLHLTEEFAAMQRELAERIGFVHALAAKHGIKLATTDETPIAFIPCGPDQAMFQLFHAIGRHGFFVAPAVFPAVAENKAGLRLTVSLHNTKEDTERLMQVLAEEMRRIREIVDYQARFQPLTPPVPERPLKVAANG
jgi:7-keto-8-aminopelargonate synthetase-like enzyme